MMTRKEITACKATRVEDNSLLHLMEEVRKLNGLTKKQNEMAENLLGHAKELIRRRDAAFAKGENYRAFLLGIQAHGYASFISKAWEEWARFDREGEERLLDD